MSKEFQIRDGNLIASFDLENEDGDIDFCKLLKVSHGVADEIGMFVDYVAINKIIKDQSKQISDLEAKLAEKEKEIERIKTNYVGGVQNANLATSAFKDLYYKEHQDKISFAVEQLEKVKVALKTFEFNYNGVIDCCEDYVFDIIDNQIKQLKEGK